MDGQLTDRPEKKSIGGDLVIPGAAVVFTLYYFSTILDSPWTAQVSAFFIGTILISLIGVFLVVSFRALARGDADLRMTGLLAPAMVLPKRLVLLGLTLAYTVLVEYGGFTITTFAFLFAAMALLNEGRNKRFAVLLSLALALSLSGYLLFIVAFGTRFPAGPFERLMDGLF